MRHAIIIILFFIMPSSAYSQINKQLSLNVDTKDLIIESNISELFESVKFVKLETNDNALFGKLFKAKIFNNKIYLLPIGGKNGIIVFSIETGKFISNISKQGRGPGEYQFLFDFDIDEDGSLFLLTGRQVLEYDSVGNFKKDSKLTFQADNIVSFNNDMFALGSNFGGPEITIVNNRFKDLKTYFPYEIHRNLYSNLLQTVDGICYYFKPNYGKFYKIDLEGAEPFLEITFEGYTPNREITLNAIENLKNSELSLENDYHKELRSRGYSPFNFLLSPDQLYGTLQHIESRYLLQYSFITNKYKLYNLNQITDDITGDKNSFVHHILTRNNEVVYLIQPYKILKKDKDELYPALYKMIKNLKEESNPILLIGKLKSF